MNEARNKGLIAFRSAGSHSPIDVVIIDVENRIVDFVQCKPDDLSLSKIEKLEEEMGELNNFFKCGFYVR